MIDWTSNCHPWVKFLQSHSGQQNPLCCSDSHLLVANVVISKHEFAVSSISIRHGKGSFFTTAHKVAKDRVFFPNLARTSVRQILAIHDITSTFMGVSHLRQLFTPIRLFKGRIKILWLSIIINKMSKFSGMFTCLPQRHPSSITNPPILVQDSSCAGQKRDR